VLGKVRAVKIHNVNVIGVGVDEKTRCAHYHSDRDIVAIRFKCCDKWYPCHLCHESSGHATAVWPKNEFDARAVLCGCCGYQLTVREYLECDSGCPRCRHLFNPGCTNHYHVYFDVSATMAARRVSIGLELKDAPAKEVCAASVPFRYSERV
jgi:uncharacterized CHY-type Zn-finger protein